VLFRPGGRLAFARQVGNNLRVAGTNPASRALCSDTPA
jgi:hypothetical protein